MRDREMRIQRGVVSCATILVVSDNAIIINVYNNLLYGWGYDAFAVNKEEPAIQAIGEGTTIRLVIVWISKAKEERPRVEQDQDTDDEIDDEKVFDGLRVAERIRKRSKRIRLLLIGDEGLRKRAKELDTLFLPSSHNIRQFKLAVRELMGQPRRKPRIA